MLHFSIDLHPVVGWNVLYVDRATELVLVRVMPGLLHIIDKSNCIVQVWRFPADIVSLCLVRAKTREGRKCKVIVSTNNGRVWCLYFPPPWLPVPASIDDMLSSQVDPDAKIRHSRSTSDGSSQETKRQKIAPSTDAKAKLNSRAPISVVDIKNVASRNCVTSKDAFPTIFLLGDKLLAFHNGTKQDPKNICVHSMESFQPYFDQHTASSTPTSTPAPSTPLNSSQAALAFTPTPRTQPKLDSLPSPKHFTSIPSKDLTSLISLSLAREQDSADNAIDKVLFGALFGLDKIPTVLVWGDVSGKVQFTSPKDFSLQSVLFDLKEPVKNLIVSKATNSLVIIGVLGKIAVLSVSKEGNLIYATKSMPISPITHSSLVSMEGIVMCGRGKALFLRLPTKLEEIISIQPKILPLSGVVGISMCNQGSAVVLLKSGRLLKLRDIATYSTLNEQSNTHPHMLQPLLELMSQISKAHSDVMKGKVAQQNEELMLTNKAIHIFSELKAFTDHPDKDPPLSTKVAIFPAPHMAPTRTSCNLILRCCVKNSHGHEFQRNFWSLNIRVSQRDYPGTFTFTFSQPLDLEKSAVCTIDVPLRVQSVCPLSVSCFLTFKCASESQGAALQISTAVFDIFDILNPILSPNSLLTVKPNNYTVFVQLITGFLKTRTNKSKLLSPLPFPSTPVQFEIASSTYNNLLHDLFSSGETGLPPHKVLQNTALAIGKTPFGEKISLATTTTTNSSHLEIQYQHPTTSPLLHSTVTQRLLNFLCNLPDTTNSPKHPLFTDILALQSKLQAIQKTLHDGSNKLSYLWHKNDKSELRATKTTLTTNAETMRLTNVERNYLQLIEMLEMCTIAYEQANNVLGNKFVV